MYQTPISALGQASAAQNVTGVYSHGIGSGQINGSPNERITVEQALEEIGKLASELREMSVSVADKIGAPNSPAMPGEPLGMSLVDRLRAFRTILIQTRANINGALTTLG